jgi:hypothetical protein
MSVVLDDIELTVQKINTGESRGLAEHRLPGLDGSIFQDMGTEPVAISLEGTIHGSEALSNLEELRSKFKEGEPVTFVADIATATEVALVLIEDLTVIEVAGRPNYFRYAIKLQQYQEPDESALEQLQQEQISLDSAMEAESFLKETEKVMELDAGLKEIGIDSIKIGDVLAPITDLLKELGLLDLLGYTAPTFGGKVIQVFDDLASGLSDAAAAKDMSGKIAAIVKTFALILGKAVFTEVGSNEKSGWDGLTNKVVEGVSG